MSLKSSREKCGKGAISVSKLMCKHNGAQAGRCNAIINSAISRPVKVIPLALFDAQNIRSVDGHSRFCGNLIRCQVGRPRPREETSSGHAVTSRSRNP